MIAVGIQEAQKRLPELLVQVEHGECIEIKRHGRPVATLVAVGARNQIEVNSALAALFQLRKQMKERGVTMKSLLNDKTSVCQLAHSDSSKRVFAKHANKLT